MEFKGTETTWHIRNVINMWLPNFQASTSVPLCAKWNLLDLRKTSRNGFTLRASDSAMSCLSGNCDNLCIWFPNLWLLLQQYSCSVCPGKWTRTKDPNFFGVRHVQAVLQPCWKGIRQICARNGSPWRKTWLHVHVDANERGGSIMITWCNAMWRQRDAISVNRQSCVIAEV